MKKVHVEAPASSANLGPGFDVFALALDRPRDSIMLRAEGSKRLSVEMKQGKDDPTPRTVAKNGAGAVCLAMARDRGIEERIVIELEKHVPIGLGMGSSGASAAAAAFAMNELFDLGLSDDDLIFYSGKGEEATSGTAHYDNVSASMLGGFVIVRAGERPSAIRMDPPEEMSLCIVTPLLKLPERKTEYARSIVPRTVRLKAMVANVANASTMVSGFARGDVRLIGSGMVDRAVEEARKCLIPGYERVKRSAIQAGASGVCISGAGPSMLAVVDEGHAAPHRVLGAMIEGFKEGGVDANGFVTKAGEGAARVGSR